MTVTIKGNCLIRGNSYIYKTDNLLGDRCESSIEIYDDKIVLKPDILGINKIYFMINGRDVIISNKFRDFYSIDIADEFKEFQIRLGYVPYPFTILKNVRKTFPGIEHIIYKEDDGGDWRIKYDTSKMSDFFRREKCSAENFKKDLLSRIEKMKKTCNRNVIVSLSGGFDSILLAHLFKEHLVGIVNYSDSPNELKEMQNRIGGFIPGVPWHVFLPDTDLEKEDVAKYFDSVDEPCCDVASLANFLMLRKLIKSYGYKPGLQILNGEGADSLFLRERAYFKEYLLEKFFFMKRSGLNLNRLIRFESVHGKILDYFKSTRTRFYDDYTEHLKIDYNYQREIDEAYGLYDRSISTERANFSGILDILLYCSNQATDKLKTAANGLSVKFLVPFYDTDMLRFVFSIDPSFKTGYLSGKMILKRSFKEIGKGLYRTGSTWQTNLWRKVAGIDTALGYRRYYYERWLSEKRDKA